PAIGGSSGGRRLAALPSDRRGYLRYRRTWRRSTTAEPTLPGELRRRRWWPDQPLYRGNAARPAYRAAWSSSSSIRSSWLYLLIRSPRAGAPVLICPAFT